MSARLRLAAVALACLTAVPALADWDRDKLDKAIEGIEQASKGRLGVALMDLRDRQLWSHRGSETFPMQSVFKLPLAVAVLQQVEAGKFRLDQPITVTRKDFSLFHSPLAKAFKGERNDYPLRELIRLAAGESDNTAADLLMREIGGPQVVTKMLRDGGVQGMSIDRYER
ncbi:MAG: class A beta-lactamase-related serine hydrolase, partial [Proteobacteria bacterium]|nr:class A beta-lactamase-related serine hydrolase [Pseudomonadota bacterium]